MLSIFHTFTARSKYYTNAYLDTVQNRISVVRHNGVYCKGYTETYTVTICTHPYTDIEVYYIYPHSSDVYVYHYGTDNYNWVWRFYPEIDLVHFSEIGKIIHLISRLEKQM